MGRASAPILYAKGYPVLRIASSDSWAYGYPNAANPFVDSTMKFAGMRLEHDLFDYTRLQKIEYLSHQCNYDNCSKPYLTICQQKMKNNCCDCGKCLATIMGIYAIGDDPIDYGFFTSREVIIENVKKMLSENITSLTKVERFCHIQDKIRQRLAAGDSSAKDLAWLLEYDLKKYYFDTYEYTYQQLIPWDSLQKICPEVYVPEHYLNGDYKHALIPVSTEAQSGEGNTGFVSKVNHLWTSFYSCIA